MIARGASNSFHRDEHSHAASRQDVDREGDKRGEPGHITASPHPCILPHLSLTRSYLLPMDSSAQHPASSSRHHRPYFTDLQISMLSEKQRGKISASQEDKMKQLACSFIEGMGEKIGLYVSVSLRICAY